MPEIGEIKKVQRYRYGTKAGYASYIWHACVECGKERWVALRGKDKIIRNLMCRHCGSRKGAQALNRMELRKGNKWGWKGGRNKTPSGYILVWISKDDGCYPMANKDGYLPEHRLVMARHLGRCLSRQEQVHHKNGIRDDNRIENLELMPDLSRHARNLICSQCELRKEIRLLHWQIKEQSEQIKNLTTKLMGVN